MYRSKDRKDLKIKCRIKIQKKAKSMKVETNTFKCAFLNAIKSSKLRESGKVYSKNENSIFRLANVNKDASY